MIRKALAVLAWLAGGHLVAAAMFWLLVNTPDSNALMVGASAALVLALVALTGTVEGTAGAWLLPGRTFREAVRDGLRAVPAFVLALVVYGGFWWITARIDAWHTAHHSEIDAWFIAKFNAPDAVWPHRVIDVFGFVVRDVLGLSMAIALLFAALEGGLRGVARLRWPGAAISRDQITLVAIGVTLFIALPWRFAGWRPNDLPVSWVQPAFAATKLSLIYAAMTVGWAICLLAGARNASSRS
jgi:hypothetical protein